MNKILKKAYKELGCRSFVRKHTDILYILSLFLSTQNFDNTNQMSSVFMYIGLHFILFDTDF